MAVSIDDFRRQAHDWLASVDDAPADWGPILPPRLEREGRAWQRRLHEAGFAGIHWPEEHGGRGLSDEHWAAWLEEAAGAGVPPVLNMVGLVLAANALLAFGTDEQKAAHLRPTVTGERVWCQLFSEPDAGSDLASLSTRAERDGDVYVVNGQKVWSSGASFSDWGILLARTASLDEAPKHRGISFFLLDMSLAGVSTRPLRQMTGEAEFDEVFFDDVRVPADCLVGPLHGGWGVAMATLTNERGFIGASAVALGRRLDDVARSLPSDVVRRDRLVALMTQGRALQRLAQRQGPVATTASSLVKLGLAEMALPLASARGDEDAIVQSPGARLGGGTSEVQKNIIGELVLGLPKEPKP
jgi:alkylation response protein AidB-like acyl-CoA dehydrogenase